MTMRNNNKKNFHLENQMELYSDIHEKRFRKQQLTTDKYIGHIF